MTDVYYAGTESKWNSMIRGNSNNSFRYATIHFNSAGPSDEIIPLEVEKVTPAVDTETNTVSFSVTVIDESRADELNEVELFVAEYDSESRFVGLTLGTKGEIEGDTVTITANIPEAENYKIMLWDGNNVPLMDVIDNIAV